MIETASPGDINPSAVTTPSSLSQDNGQRSVWMDGKVIPWSDARIHVATHGLHYATTVIEAIRVYHGKPLQLVERLRRLQESAVMLHLKIPYSTDKLCDAVYTLLDLGRIKDAYIRPVAWLGAESGGAGSPVSPSCSLELSPRGLTTHVAILALPVDETFSMRHYKDGLRLMISPWARPAPHTAPVSTKSAGMYPISIISRAEAEQQGCHDALMLDHRGYVAEGTGANVFLVIEGDLHTPLPDSLLNGFTRQLIMSLAIQDGLRVIERAIHPDELLRAQEIFLTGTAYEIAPVREILTMGEYPHGPVTQRLQTLFQDHVASL